MINLKEFERLLLTNWTIFINPQKLIAFVLSKVRDSELNTINKNPPTEKTSLQIKLSQFTPNQDRTFNVWVDFIVPNALGTAVGTCELRFDHANGSIEHLQTIGNIFTSSN
jgi:hypothetical protein